jgi:hypothetical protein
MKTTTLQLLPTTTYGTPSGNYDGSSQDFSGPQQKAAAYYGGFGDLQTVAIFLLNFQGKLRIEATLESVPASSADWFRVEDYNYTSSTTTTNFSTNITGNFTWMRASVEDFTAGTITKVMLSY